MKTARLALCAVFAATVLAACEEKIDVPMDTPQAAGDSADATGAAAADATAAPADDAPVDATANQPVVVDADAVRVGASLGPQGATGAKPAYSTSDTVHASLAAAGRTGTAKVDWSDGTGIAVKDEEKPMSGDHVSFDFSRADGMKAGKYTVEIDVDDVPAGISEFTVK